MGRKISFYCLILYSMIFAGGATDTLRANKAIIDTSIRSSIPSVDANGIFQKSTNLKDYAYTDTAQKRIHDSLAAHPFPSHVDSSRASHVSDTVLHGSNSVIKADSSRASHVSDTVLHGRDSVTNSHKSDTTIKAQRSVFADSSTNAHKSDTSIKAQRAIFADSSTNTHKADTSIKAQRSVFSDSGTNSHKADTAKNSHFADSSKNSHKADTAIKATFSDSSTNSHKADTAIKSQRSIFSDSSTNTHKADTSIKAQRSVFSDSSTNSHKADTTIGAKYLAGQLGSYYLHSIAGLTADTAIDAAKWAGLGMPATSTSGILRNASGTLSWKDSAGVIPDTVHSRLGMYAAQGFTSGAATSRLDTTHFNKGICVDSNIYAKNFKLAYTSNVKDIGQLASGKQDLFPLWSGFWSDRLPNVPINALEYSTDSVTWTDGSTSLVYARHITDGWAAGSYPWSINAATQPYIRLTFYNTTACYYGLLVLYQEYNAHSPDSLILAIDESSDGASWSHKGATKATCLTGQPLPYYTFLNTSLGGQLGGNGMIRIIIHLLDPTFTYTLRSLRLLTDRLKYGQFNGSPIQWTYGGVNLGYSNSSLVQAKLAVQSQCPASNPVFTGTGLNDARTFALYDYAGTAASDQTYTIIIDGTGTPDTYEWEKGSGAFTTGVAITGSAQTLTDGIRILFLATTGHTLGDQWVITVKAIQPFYAYNANGNSIFTVGNDSNTTVTGHLTVTKKSTYNDSLRIQKAAITYKDSVYYQLIVKDTSKLTTVNASAVVIAAKDSSYGKVIGLDSIKCPNLINTGVTVSGKDSSYGQVISIDTLKSLKTTVSAKDSSYGKVIAGDSLKAPNIIITSVSTTAKDSSYGKGIFLDTIKSLKTTISAKDSSYGKGIFLDTVKSAKVTVSAKDSSYGTIISFDTAKFWKATYSPKDSGAYGIFTTSVTSPHFIGYADSTAKVPNLITIDSIKGRAAFYSYGLGAYDLFLVNGGNTWGYLTAANGGSEFISNSGYPMLLQTIDQYIKLWAGSYINLLPTTGVIVGNGSLPANFTTGNDMYVTGKIATGDSAVIGGNAYITGTLATSDNIAATKNQNGNTQIQIRNDNNSTTSRSSTFYSYNNGAQWGTIEEASPLYTGGVTMEQGNAFNIISYSNTNGLNLFTYDAKPLKIGVNGTAVISLSATGETTIADTCRVKALQFTTLPPIYANNAAAVAGGEKAGMIYRTGGDPDLICICH